MKKSSSSESSASSPTYSKTSVVLEEEFELEDTEEIIKFSDAQMIIENNAHCKTS
jgi:hypothetical protein